MHIVTTLSFLQTDRNRVGERRGVLWPQSKWEVLGGFICLCLTRVTYPYIRQQEVGGQREITGRGKPWREGYRRLSKRHRCTDGLNMQTIPEKLTLQCGNTTRHTKTCLSMKVTNTNAKEVYTYKNKLTGTRQFNSVTDSLSVWVCKYCLFNHGPN